MLALRLARGLRPWALGRRLLLTGGAAGVGFLLLAALGYALAHPGDGGAAALRLACCAVPLAATVQLAVAVGRADPAVHSRSGLAAAGLGPARVPTLAATSTALAGLLGSVLALLAFLLLRGDFSGLPGLGGLGGALDEASGGALAGGRPLPLPAVVTLMAVVPTVAAVATGLSLRPRPDVSPSPPGPVGTGRGEAAPAEPPVPAPGGLPWGTALTTAGVALSVYAAPGGAAASTLALPGALATVTPGMAGGWLLVTAGVVTAAPDLTYRCGRMLAAGRPGARRLLAGRSLQHEAVRLGRPLGALTAATAALLAALRLEGPGLFGPLGVVGATVVVACLLGTLGAAVAQARAERGDTVAALTRLGASRRLLRGVATLRLCVLVPGFAALAWLAAELILLPVGA
ncbi:hypothetical protein ACTWP5_16145 [Streptomyces sp. 4N509B]|uniref:hypothetical protein n=1 Tax=Streptomyces sp. 4N509B TaxID=3457413 RepID=UPI003FD59916